LTGAFFWLENGIFAQDMLFSIPVKSESSPPFCCAQCKNLFNVRNNTHPRNELLPFSVSLFQHLLRIDYGEVLTGANALNTGLILI